MLLCWYFQSLCYYSLFSNMVRYFNLTLCPLICVSILLCMTEISEYHTLDCNQAHWSFLLTFEKLKSSNFYWLLVSYYPLDISSRIVLNQILWARSKHNLVVLITDSVLWISETKIHLLRRLCLYQHIMYCVFPSVTQTKMYLDVVRWYIRGINNK